MSFQDMFTKKNAENNSKIADVVKVFAATIMQKAIITWTGFNRAASAEQNVARPQNILNQGSRRSSHGAIDFLNIVWTC